MHCVCVALQDGMVKGACFYCIEKNKCHIKLVCSEKGHGRKLLESAERAAALKGATVYDLYSMHYTKARDEQACNEMQKELRLSGPARAVSPLPPGVSFSLENFYRSLGYASDSKQVAEGQWHMVKGEIVRSKNNTKRPRLNL